MLSKEQIENIKAFAQSWVDTGNGHACQVNAHILIELIAMLEAAQKDAARYRWLTEHAYIGECFTEQGRRLEVNNCDRQVPMREYDGYGRGKVDEAIDAAMQRDCDGAHHAGDEE